MTGTEITVDVVKEVTSMVAHHFGKRVIERWTRYRAEKFFEGFAMALSEELKTGVESNRANSSLDAILHDDVKTEILYDAYRKVCFSKSKTLGPKIIGILTGYLVAQGRVATELETKIFEAAESFSDPELIDIFKDFRASEKRANACKDVKKDPHWSNDAIIIPWKRETRDTSWPSEREIDVGPVNTAEAFEGTWALRAEAIGLITSRTTQQQVNYQADSERHIDQDGTLTIFAVTITFEPPCRQLCTLIERSLGTSPVDNKA